MMPNPFQIETLNNGALGMACQRAQTYADAARAEATRDVYARAWARWATWCEPMRTDAMPADPYAVAAWLAELARNGNSVSRIAVCLSAVLHHHRAHGRRLEASHPAIAAVLAGIKRRTAKPIRRAAPLEMSDLRALVAGLLGQDLRTLRDRALILVGFWGALRRSELVHLDVAGRSPIEITPEGLLLHLTGAKGRPGTQTVALPRRADALCPVAALEQYLAASTISAGPVFRPISKAGRLIERRLTPASVTLILRRHLGAEAGSFSAHSLRAGFITAAAKAGAPEHAIQRLSRHKSTGVLRTYIRCADAFEGNAASFL